MKKFTTKSLFIFLLTSLITLFSFQTSVFGADVKGLSKEEAREMLKTLDPAIQVLSVERSAVDGLWEVITDSGGRKGILYIDYAKKNIVVGNILNIATKTNLTKNKFDEINRVDVSKVPLDDAIVMGDPKAKHKVIVFDDPD